MKLTDRFIAETADIFSRYYSHPFVKGIEDGTLDEEKFRYYIIQDYLYLIEYTRVFGIGVAKAESVESMRIFAKYIELLTDGEMDIHRGYMGRLKITQEEIDSVKREHDNLSYTSYMLRVAYDGDENDIMAAILSCAYSYELIAENIVKNNSEAVNHHFYGEWVAGYSDESYIKANRILIDAFEQMTSDCSEEKKNHLTEIFVNCSLYELDFWDFSWNFRR